jgi:hypothetical protein
VKRHDVGLAMEPRPSDGVTTPGVGLLTSCTDAGRRRESEKCLSGGPSCRLEPPRPSNGTLLMPLLTASTSASSLGWYRRWEPNAPNHVKPPVPCLCTKCKGGSGGRVVAYLLPHSTDRFVIPANSKGQPQLDDPNVSYRDDGDTVIFSCPDRRKCTARYVYKMERLIEAFIKSAKANGPLRLRS